MITKITATLTTLRSYPEFRERPLETLSRIIVWSVRRRMGFLQTLRLIEGGHPKIVLPNAGWAWEWFVFRERYPLDKELLWLREQLNLGATVCDIGAYFGFWTVMLADKVGSKGRVISFEPTKMTADHLSQTLTLNRLDQTLLVRAAVSDHSGEAKLNYGYDHGATNSLGFTGGSSESVHLVTLDQAIECLAIDCIDAMKIDTEGNEERVILGGLATIRRHLPLIVFEINPEKAEAMGLTEQGAWDLLARLGYRMYVLDKSGGLRQVDAFSQSGTDSMDWWNVIAIHPDRLTSIT